jgi:hypothetical protein
MATMLTRTLLALALSLLPVSLAAQHAPPELAAPRREQGVTVTLAGHLLPSSSGALAVPFPLMERLGQERALLALDTAPADGRIVVQARFGFADVATFQRWYTDPVTVQLLASFRAITIGGSFETFVSYRPRPAS